MVYEISWFGTFWHLRKCEGKKRKRKIYQFSKRNVNQIALDAIYRLGAKENVYIGGRYNTVNGQLLASSADKQSVNRMQLEADGS